MSFDPISLALTAALTLGGSYLQNKAQSKAANSQTSAIKAQRLANEEMRKKNTGLWEQSLAKYQGGQPMQDLDATRARLTEALSQGTGTQRMSSAIPGNISTATQEALQKGQAKAGEKVANRGVAMADLRSLGDLLQLNNIGVNRTGQQIGANAFNAKNNASILSQELAAASQGGMSPFGDLLVATGMGIGQSGFNPLKKAPVPEPDFSRLY